MGGTAMDRVNLKMAIFIAVAVLMGFAIGFGWGNVRLQNQEKVYQAKMKEISRRLSQAQLKHSQDTAQQTALEEEKRDALTIVEKLQSENEGLKSKAGSLDAKNGQLTDRLAKVEAERNSLDQKQKQTSQTLQEREKEIKQFVETRQRLQNELKRVNQRYDQCAENNAKMYVVANEVLQRYEGKGLKDKLLEKEPFTQIRKVELEKLVQDYRDKINAQKIHSK
jgi:chromosome segregation ATPase